jgi:hypothetical protein
MSDSKQTAAERAQRTLNAASQAISENFEWAARVRQNWGYDDDSAPDSSRREQISDDKVTG